MLYRIGQKRIYHDIYAMTKDKSEFSLKNYEIFVSGEQMNPYVKKALLQIANNYNKKLNIESIADDMGVSPSYLSRKFKCETSQTFLDMLNKHRIEKAVELMGDGKLRIYEISYMVGFSDYKHFCNVFKKYTNMAPTDFIKSQSYIRIRSS